MLGMILIFKRLEWNQIVDKWA